MKFYLQDWNNIFTDVKLAIGEENLAQPADADVIVLFADTRGPLKEMAERSKMMGKKVYVLQHGRASTRDYQKPLNATLIADKFLAWGQADFDRMARNGYGDKTVIVGCPLLKKVRPRVAHEDKTVLFVPVNCDHEDPDNLIVYYELLKQTIGNAQKFLNKNHDDLKENWDFKRQRGVAFHEMSGYTLIAKLLPSHAAALYHGNVIKTHPGSANHMDQLFELLANVDCVVSLDESTTEILAMAAGVPVVICDEFKWHKLAGQDYKDIEVLNTKAALHCPLTAVTNVVNMVLETPNIKEREREAVVEHELAVSLGDPIQNILKEIGFVREPSVV